MLGMAQPASCTCIHVASPSYCPIFPGASEFLDNNQHPVHGLGCRRYLRTMSSSGSEAQKVWGRQRQNIYSRARESRLRIQSCHQPGGAVSSGASFVICTPTRSGFGALNQTTKGFSQCHLTQEGICTQESVSARTDTR